MASPPNWFRPGGARLGAFNNVVFDSRHWADDPRHPTKAANLGLRIGVNLVMYTIAYAGG